MKNNFQNKNQSNIEIVARYTFWFLANVLWFGLFVYLIIFKNWNGAILTIPLIFHWQIKEIR